MYILIPIRMSEYEKVDRASDRNNPKESANIFSILSFSWMNSILATGNTRPLENNDLFPLLDEDKTQGLTERLEEMRAANKSQALYMALLLKTFWRKKSILWKQAGP